LRRKNYVTNNELGDPSEKNGRSSSSSYAYGSEDDSNDGEANIVSNAHYPKNSYSGWRDPHYSHFIKVSMNSNYQVYFLQEIQRVHSWDAETGRFSRH
jgi:hypothetical protein